MIWILFAVMMIVCGTAGFLVGIALGQERGVQHEKRERG